MRRSTRTAIIFGVFLLAVLGDVGLSSWASVKEESLATVEAIEADPTGVHVAVSGRVFAAGRDGSMLGEFVGRDGKPWRADIVSSISREPNGSFLVGETDTAEVAEFDANGRLIHRFELPFLPTGRSDVAAIGNRIWVSDTQTDQVALVNRDGTLYRSRRVRYANDANLISTEHGPAVAFVATAQSKVYALDGELRPISVPLVERINRLADAGRGVWASKAIISLWMAPDASRALLSLSRTTSGDCAFVSVTKRGEVRVLGDTDAIRPSKSFDPDAMMALQAVEAAPGVVLAASPRAGTVLSFTTSADAPSFCRTCALSELSPSAQPLEDALAGFDWPNGTHVEGFGDVQLQDQFNAAWNLRYHYRTLIHDSRMALYVLIALLLAIWGLSRLTATDRGDELPGRLELVLARLILPAAGTLLAALFMVTATAAVGAFVGHLLFGTGGAIVCGGLLSWTVSRAWITPWLVRHQGPERARAAFDAFYGPGAPRELPMLPGESVAYVSFALPERRGLEDLEGVASSALEGDAWDVVTSAIPRAVLIARTTHRLLVVKCNSWGAPVADPAELYVRAADVAPAGIVVTRQGQGVAAFRLGDRNARGETLTTDPPSYLCQECGQRAGTCVHRRPALSTAFVLSAILPGGGQLAQRRFGPGRLFAVLAVVTVVAIGHGLVPQMQGYLPWRPSVWMGSVVAFIGLWVMGLFELVMNEKVEERRSQVARGL